MKVALVFAALAVAASLADPIPWSDPSAQDKYATHYTSHKDTVSAARRGVHERLQEYGVNENAHYASTDGRGDLQQIVGYAGEAPCTISCGSNVAATASEFASASDVEQVDQSHIGQGYVGFNTGAAVGSSNSDYASTSQFSESAHTAAAAANVHVLPVAVAAADNSNSRSQYASSSEHQHHVSASPSAAIVVPITSGGGADLERYTSHSEHITQTAAAPATTYVYTVPASAGSDSESYRSSRLSSSTKTGSAYRPVYTQVPVITYPSVSNDRHFHNEQHTSEQLTNTAALPITAHYIYQPQPSISENSRRSERISTANSNYNVRAQPIIYQPAINTGSNSHLYNRHESERVVSAQNAQPLHITVAVPRPAHSSHSSRIEENRSSSSSSNSHQAAAQPLVVAYAPYAAVPAASSSASSLYRSENYANSANSNANVGSVYFPNPALQRPSARVGASLYGGGSNSFQATSLSGLISESERLAREQSLSGSGSLRGSATINNNAAFERFDDNSNTLGVGAVYGGAAAGRSVAGGGSGAFHRTKQWENNEKWSSGTQYDENGRPRSYSTLSTAESELHNVNGKSAGYKAATTTLEDDGRVSTYSLHT